MQQAALQLLTDLSYLSNWYGAVVGGDSQCQARGARAIPWVKDFLASWIPWAAAAAQLERNLQQQGFSPTISAAQLQQLFLMHKLSVWSLLAGWGGDLGTLVPEALQTARHLCQLDPANPTYLWRLANRLSDAPQLSEAARTLRMALQLAEESKGAVSGALNCWVNY